VFAIICPNNSKYAGRADRYFSFDVSFCIIVILFAITNPHFNIIEQIGVIEFRNDALTAVSAGGVV
jgi:hypothetical protein